MGSGFSIEKCDVFISFIGEDTLNNFTTHLYAALEKNGIKTYMDEKSNKYEEEASSVLLKAIKRVKLSVIVFSEKYATSSWCLDELVRIIKCKEKRGQIVVPVFYGVDPSDVRELKGGFDISRENFEDGNRKVKKWSEALKKAGNISGFDFDSMRSEAKLTEEIVKDIKQKLEVRSEEEQAAARVSVIAFSAVVGGAGTTC